MRFKKVHCQKCSAGFEVEEARTSFSCPNCNAVHLGGKIQEVSAPLAAGNSFDPGTAEISADEEPSANLDVDFARLSEAEQYKLQAEFILHALQANVQVYGSNSAWAGAQPADVELAIRYINRSLEYYPDNPAYLNLKALLLIEGMDRREEGLAILERAHQLNPRDITIEDNLNKLKSSACFVATAAYGSSEAWQVHALRRWRDEILLTNPIGEFAVAAYYRLSPSIAGLIKRNWVLKHLVRAILFPMTRSLARRYDR